MIRDRLFDHPESHPWYQTFAPAGAALLVLIVCYGSWVVGQGRQWQASTWGSWLSALMVAGLVLCRPDGRRSAAEWLRLTLCGPAFYFLASHARSNLPIGAACTHPDQLEIILFGAQVAGPVLLFVLALASPVFLFLLLGRRTAPRGPLPLRSLRSLIVCAAAVAFGIGLVYSATRASATSLLRESARRPLLAALSPVPPERVSLLRSNKEERRTPDADEARAGPFLLAREFGWGGGRLLLGPKRSWPFMRCDPALLAGALTVRDLGAGAALLLAEDGPLVLLSKAPAVDRQRLIPLTEASLARSRPIAPPPGRILGAGSGLLLAALALRRVRRARWLLRRRALWCSAHHEGPGRLRFPDRTLLWSPPAGSVLPQGPVVVVAQPGSGPSYRELGALHIEDVHPGTIEALPRQLHEHLTVADAQAIATVVLLGAPLWASLLG